VDIQQIVGAARSVSQSLSNTRYGLDFYQREYRWAEAQVADLLDDHLEPGEIRTRRICLSARR